MKCDYEFIVFNDAKQFPDYTNDGDVTLYNKIIDTCSKLNIQCINIPNDHHRYTTDSAVRCNETYSYILQYQLENLDTYLCIDGDMFLIDIFYGNEYDKYDCAVLRQERQLIPGADLKTVISEPNRKYLTVTKDNKIQYIWNGIHYFDMNKIQNKDLLNWNYVEIGDVGTSMSSWLYLQEQSKIKNISALLSLHWNEEDLPEHLKQHNIASFLQRDPRNQNNRFFCELYENKFLHYRSGGNWRHEGVELHLMLAKQLQDALCNY